MSTCKHEKVLEFMGSGFMPVCKWCRKNELQKDKKDCNETTKTDITH